MCKIYNGGTPDTKNRKYWNGNIQWLTPRDMGKLSNEYTDISLRQLTDEGLKKSFMLRCQHNYVRKYNGRD